MHINQKQRIAFMRQALSLAARGTSAVAPNPRVGAVIVKDGKITGRGYHKKFGQNHAEIEALNDCHKHNNDPHNATMFVTLEPCCHYGKTGPCTLAIADAGITVVEIATLDDFAMVNGRGATWLREHGIEVHIGCCEHQARRLNAGFFKLQKEHRPQVILKWAQSIDAYLSWPVPAHSSVAMPRQWITGEKSRRHVHKLRRNCGAILTGIGTALADDPLLNVRLPSQSPQPVRIVLDTHLRINPASRLVQTAHQQKLLICTLEDDSYNKLYSTGETPRETSKETRLQRIQTLTQHNCEIIKLPADTETKRPSLPALLNELASRGITDLLVEGGPIVLDSFLKQNLADKIMVYIAPVIIAGHKTAESKTSPCSALKFTTPLKKLYDVKTTKLDNDILIEGYTHPS